MNHIVYIFHVVLVRVLLRVPDLLGVTDGVLERVPDLLGVTEGVTDGVLDLLGVTEGVPDLLGVTD